MQIKEANFLNKAPSEKGVGRRQWRFWQPRASHCGAAALLGLVVWLACVVWAPPAARDLSRSDAAHVSELVAEWHRGGVIVLVRHLERCSRVDAACLGAASGITARSTVVGAELASEFSELGLAHADIFTSPRLRTTQTAELLFDDDSVAQDFLYKCEDNFLEDARRRKASGRNLILVTHSSCMDESEEALELSDVKFDYGTALFISASKPGPDGVLGFVDAADWDLVFGS